MLTPKTDKFTLRHSEAIEHLVAQGMPLCRIEEMLDEMECELARHVPLIPPSRSWVGHLLWI
jgi:hypothetical protein